MYKKITHNIVEEHFDHPLATELKKKMEHTPVVPKNQMLSLSDPLPQYVMNEASMVFRMDARSLWSKYAWGLLNYGISMAANLPIKEQVEARTFKNARALGDFITPYYGITAGNALSDVLAGIGQIGIDVVKAVQEKESLDKLRVIWAKLIDDLAELLHDLNPNFWPETLTRDYFTNMVEYWVDEITARAAKNTVADDEAIENLNKLMVFGVPNSVPSHKTSSYADVFSRGIIAQFPSMFSE